MESSALCTDFYFSLLVREEYIPCYEKFRIKNFGGIYYGKRQQSTINKY